MASTLASWHRKSTLPTTLRSIGATWFVSMLSRWPTASPLTRTTTMLIPTRRTRTRTVIPTTSWGVNKVPFDVSHVAFDVSPLCWEYGWCTCCYSFLMLLLLLMYLPLHFMSDAFKCTEVLICEVWFACLCFLLLNFVLGGLNSVDHGVDQVLWLVGSRFLAPVGWFCLQVSFIFSFLLVVW